MLIAIEVYYFVQKPEPVQKYLYPLVQVLLPELSLARTLLNSSYRFAVYNNWFTSTSLQVDNRYIVYR